MKNKALFYTYFTYHGYEDKVKENIIKRIQEKKLQNYFLQIISFPMDGYLIIKMHGDKKVFELIHNTPGITGYMTITGLPNGYDGKFFFKIRGKVFEELARDEMVKKENKNKSKIKK
jgi:transcription antitermination factor NusG